MQEYLINLSTNHAIWVYVIIIFIAFAEGPYISLILGVLIKLKYFIFLPVYFSLMIGDLIGDVLWYHIGYFYGHRFIRRFGKYFNVSENNIEKVKDIFHKHKHPILFISKITNGFGFALATLITSGMVKLPFLRYIMINIAGQFIWTGILIGTGYLFGNLYTEISTIAGRIFIGLLFVIAIMGVFRLKKYMEKKMVS